MVLTSAQAASLADRQRVWQVRRFCQVRHAHRVPDQSEDQGSHHVETGDAALSALLRCLLFELDADLAAISLLDEQTQYFLSVAQKSTMHDPTVGGADWFGCDQIPVKGGICERTITQESTAQQDPVFEILDLLADDTTTMLPVVNGKFASFMSYAGVPLTTPDGLHVGALFVFKNELQLRHLPLTSRRYLCQTARDTMRQLTKTVGALQNKHSLQCNSTASSFINNHALKEISDTSRQAITTQTTHRHTLSAGRVFEMAASLMANVFELEGVIIQELPRSDVSQNVHLSQRQTLLAEWCGKSTHKSGPIENSVAEMLQQTFPTGAILQVLSTEEGGVFLSLTEGEPGVRKMVRLDFDGRFLGTEQFLFMPLRDSFHDRDSAFILGWTSRFSRVYHSATDLPSLSYFGTGIMTQVRRLEALDLSRKKSDFLGSISHEMRSPLHGILSLVSHLRDTKCSAEQLELLESAESCGLLLQSNIDKILLYSSISSPSSESPKNSQLSFPDYQRMAASTIGPNSFSEGRDNMLSFIEDTIDRAVRQSKSTQSSTELEHPSMWPRDPFQPTSSIARRTMIVVDADPMTNFPLAACSDVRIIISNLLVSPVSM